MLHKYQKIIVNKVNKVNDTSVLRISRVRYQTHAILKILNSNDRKVMSNSNLKFELDTSC